MGRHDYGTLLLLAVVGAGLSIPAQAFAQWAPGGVLVPGSLGGGPLDASDGAGGVWIGWSDDRTYLVTEDDIYAQHLTGSGLLAPGAPPAGLPVCVAPQAQFLERMVPDGLGGTYFGWHDFRLAGNWYTPCAQHVDASGALASGWPAAGLALTLSATSDGSPEIASDGSGGVFFAWIDYRDSPDAKLYLQHLTASGVPAPGWPVGGRSLAPGPGSQGFYTPLLTDGAGGVLALWGDGRPGAVGIYMEHVQGDGTPAPGSIAGGVRVATGRRFDGVAPDGLGGCYLALTLGSTLYVGQDSTYYLLRITSSGATAPGWTPNGTLVCTADFIRGGPIVSADASGHVFLAWRDSRGHGYSHVYATQYLADGTLAPGWQSNGTPAATLPGYQVVNDMLADGNGGMFIAGEYDAGGADYGFIQHLSGSASPAAGWGDAGQALNPLSNQYGARLAPDGAGGAFVTWNNTYAGVYANHYPGDSPTATLLSLASADAQSDRVTLLWQGDAASSVTASVERRTDSGDWMSVGSPAIDGTDRLRYEDRDVAAGARYAYRLRYSLGGIERTTSEAWVSVPGAAQLALAGLRPNPSSGSNLRVAFSLPDAGSARLELIDIAGRRIAAREVGGLGAGSHIEPLRTDSRVPAGLYWLRLTQGSHSLVTRAVVTG